MLLGQTGTTTLLPIQQNPRDHVFLYFWSRLINTFFFFGKLWLSPFLILQLHSTSTMEVVWSGWIWEDSKILWKTN